MLVLLRPWSAADASALVAARHSDPDLDTQFSDAGLTTIEEATAYIESALSFTERAKHWAIVENGVAVGNVGLSAIEWQHETAWVSYWLAAGARRRGYAARAVIAVARSAFDGGLHRLELGHRVNNPGSCAVATRARFAVEGIERQKLRYGTRRFDVETHARLSTDPEPDRPGLDFA